MRTFSKYTEVSQKILVVRRVTWRRLRTEDSQMLSTSVINVVSAATWRPIFMHPYIAPLIIPGEQFWSRNTLAPGGTRSLVRFTKCTRGISHYVVKCKPQGIRKSWQVYFEQSFAVHVTLFHNEVVPARCRVHRTWWIFWVKTLRRLWIWETAENFSIC